MWLISDHNFVHYTDLETTMMFKRANWTNIWIRAFYVCTILCLYDGYDG